jgi:hypothetical protein
LSEGFLVEFTLLGYGLYDSTSTGWVGDSVLAVQEVMMALREQTQMMHDQLDLLCKIPGLEKAGGKVKQTLSA